MNGQFLEETIPPYPQETNIASKNTQPPKESNPEPLTVGGTSQTETGWDPLQEIHLDPISEANFQRLTPSSGALRIQAYTAGQAVPVPDAQVTVSKTFTDGRRVYATGATNKDGILDGISLPAPYKSLSQTPGNIPYAVYDIEVSHPGYRTEKYSDVPVFEGILSIQPVRFIPYRPTI